MTIKNISKNDLNSFGKGNLHLVYYEKMDDLVERWMKIAVNVLLKLVMPLCAIPRLWHFIKYYKSDTSEDSFQLIYLAS